MVIQEKNCSQTYHVMGPACQKVSPTKSKFGVKLELFVIDSGMRCRLPSDWAL